MIMSLPLLSHSILSDCQAAVKGFIRTVATASEQMLLFKLIWQLLHHREAMVSCSDERCLAV